MIARALSPRCIRKVFEVTPGEFSSRTAMEISLSSRSSKRRRKSNGLKLGPPPRPPSRYGSGETIFASKSGEKLKPEREREVALRLMVLVAEKWNRQNRANVVDERSWRI
jgi:hypothetical protein